MVARFIRYYGHDAYHAPARWDTADRIVPARLFMILLGMIPAIDAGEQLRFAEASQLGQVAAEGGSKSAVRSAFRKLARAAVPKRYPSVEPTERES